MAWSKDRPPVFQVEPYHFGVKSYRFVPKRVKAMAFWGSGMGDGSLTERCVAEKLRAGFALAERSFRKPRFGLRLYPPTQAVNP
jgi:hypothetical protein